MLPVDSKTKSVENLKNNDEINRAAIIKAAAGLFQKWGFNKTTMEDIAKAAGKGKSTLYYYYKSKEEIFYTFMSQTISAVITTAESRINNEVTAEDKLRVYVATFIGEVKKYATLYEIVRGEMKDFPLMMEKIRKLFFSEEINLINSIIKDGIQNKEFKIYNDIDVTMVSYTFISAIVGLLEDLYIDNRYFHDEDRADILLELLFYGIKN